MGKDIFNSFAEESLHMDFKTNAQSIDESSQIRYTISSMTHQIIMMQLLYYCKTVITSILQ